MRRLFRLQLKEQLKFLQKNLESLQMVQVRASTLAALANAMPSFENLREQIIDAAIDRTCMNVPLPVNRTEFVQRTDDARGRVSLIAQEIARLITHIVDQVAAISSRLQSVKAFPRVIADIDRQLAQLFAPRFIVRTPVGQLTQYPRYLKAIAVRIEKLKADPAGDSTRMNDVATLQTAWERTINERRGVEDPRLDEFRWLLEELRVSLFAQELRTPMPVSVKRLQKIWNARR